MTDDETSDLSPVNFMGLQIAPMAKIPKVTITVDMVTNWIRHGHYNDPMLLHYLRNGAPFMVHGTQGYNGQLGKFGYQFDVKTGFMIYTDGKVVKRFRS